MHPRQVNKNTHYTELMHRYISKRENDISTAAAANTVAVAAVAVDFLLVCCRQQKTLSCDERGDK